MPVYDINFDATAFTAEDLSKDDLHEELHEEFIAAFNETSIAEGNFPEGVLEVRQANLSPDDGGREEGEWKLFANVTLRMIVPDGTDPEDVKAPEGLLATLVDSMNIKADLDGAWEILDVETPEPTISPAA